ncbi:winged helix-turn-helix domain-containing protein [Natronomonas marina]|jgi:DNA-binding transcriptional ArsR family regulator|uniref:winged helix-turn-helix domain-containing protein n=1 Tax=Natronomonas marina TaxID=2961939 RepID=UPI0020C952E4|nr:winged helix-turn-helix domain-containing protein [Natronomonas marina]
MEDEPTILLVGDDAAFAERFVEVASDGYRVRRVRDGGQAVEAASDGVALVAVDERGDGVGPRRFPERLRADGYDGRVLALHESDPGATGPAVDDHLVAPLAATALRDAVEELVAPAVSGPDATVFEALGDAKARRCCRALVEAPLSASELADATGYSLPTVYRRLEELQAAGLVEASTRIRDGGGNCEVYRTVTTAVRVDIEDGFRVDVERETDGSRV